MRTRVEAGSKVSPPQPAWHSRVEAMSDCMSKAKDIQSGEEREWGLREEARETQKKQG